MSLTFLILLLNTGGLDSYVVSRRNERKTTMSLHRLSMVHYSIFDLCESKL